MIGMTAFRAISHEFACLAVKHDGSWNTTARRRDKKGAPAGSQAIDMAWLPAGASVGSRATRREKMRFFKSHSGTCPRKLPPGSHL